MIKTKLGALLFSISLIIGGIVATSGNIYAAINPAGGSWSVVGSGATGAKYDSIAVNPFNSNMIYAVRAASSTPGAATLLSNDGGATWNTWVFNFQGQALRVGSFTLEAVNKTILITSGTRLFVTQDGGTTWAEIGAGSSNKIIRNSNGVIHIHQYNSSNANGAVFSNIRKSADGGITWVTLGSRPAWFPMGDHFIDDTTGTWYRYGSRVIVTDANGGWVSIGINGIQKSTDTGTTWVDVTTSAAIATSVIKGFWVDSKTGNLLVLPDEGTLKNKLYVSADGGNTWQLANTGGVVFSLTLNATFFYEDAFNSGVLYINDDGIVGTANMVSLDGGVTWADTNFPNFWSCRGVSLATDTSGVVYCGSNNGNNFLGSALIKFTPALGTATAPAVPATTTAAPASSGGGGSMSPWMLLAALPLLALRRRKS